MPSDERWSTRRESYIDGHVDRAALHHALLHVEHMIDESIARERRARALGQNSLSMVLLGRIGGLTELLSLLLADFWNLSHRGYTVDGLPNQS